MALSQESWLYLRNAWSQLSSSQKNSSGIWNKASRKMLKAAHSRLQFQIPQELPGSSQPCQVGDEEVKQAKPVIPETSETMTGKICWDKWASVGKAHQPSPSKTCNKQVSVVMVGSSWLGVWILYKFCKKLLSKAWIISSSWTWLLYLNERMSSLLLTAVSWALEVCCSILIFEISPSSCCLIFLCQESRALFSCQNTKLL